MTMKSDDRIRKAYNDPAAAAAYELDQAREVFQCLGDMLQTGGMYDPWFILGQVEALKKEYEDAQDRYEDEQYGRKGSLNV